MRTVSLFALALVVLAGVVTAYDAQAPARSVQDRWKNCSKISQGRIGALNSFGSDVVTFGSPLSFSNATYTLSITSLSPCVAAPNFVTVVTSIPSVAGSTTYDFNYAWTAASNSFVQMNQAGPVFTFVMPTQTGQVPVMNAQYSTTNVVGSGNTLNVQYNCNSATKGNITSISVSGTTMNVQIDTINACARFPFTTDNVSNGGIAAIIIVILCFIFEFAACAKFHVDKKGKLSAGELHALSEPAH